MEAAADGHPRGLCRLQQGLGWGSELLATSRSSTGRSGVTEGCSTGVGLVPGRCRHAGHSVRSGWPLSSAPRHQPGSRSSQAACEGPGAAVWVSRLTRSGGLVATRGVFRNSWKMHVVGKLCGSQTVSAPSKLSVPLPWAFGGPSPVSNLRWFVCGPRLGIQPSVEAVTSVWGLRLGLLFPLIPGHLLL